MQQFNMKFTNLISPRRSKVNSNAPPIGPSDSVKVNKFSGCIICPHENLLNLCDGRYGINCSIKSSVFCYDKKKEILNIKTQKKKNQIIKLNKTVTTGSIVPPAKITLLASFTISLN